MKKPRFFSRVIDSLGPLVGGNVDLFDVLSTEVVHLRASKSLEKRVEHVQGFLLAANLCARLYPRIIVEASDRVTAEARALIQAINPNVSLDDPHPPTVELCWSTTKSIDRSVAISAAGWNVLFEQGRAKGGPYASNALTTLAAAAFGVGELLRVVLEPFLPAERRGPSTGSFNLRHWGVHPDSAKHDLPTAIDIGHVGLIGAGAIGQAFIYTLARIKGLRGKLAIYDPEEVSLSNLQRYVLTSDADVGVMKTTIAERAFVGSSVEAELHSERWESAGELPAVLCVGLDNSTARIHVQCSLPRALYNAWTQPDDLGWSIHDSFGIQPCLACMYWPTRPKPGYHELIAESIGEHPLRVLGYLLRHKAVAQPLKDQEVPRIADTPLPDNWREWTRRSLLEDLITRFPRAGDDLASWQEIGIGDLYREGVCGGALLTHTEAQVERDLAVPLAHQSVLAGVMLAVQLVTGSTSGTALPRPKEAEGRIDILRPFPQVVPRPRAPTTGCICQDSDFRARYSEKWVLRGGQ